MKKGKIILCLLMSIMMISINEISVMAADPYLSHGCEHGDIKVKPYSSLYNSIWVSILDNGRSAWNNSSANVSIYTNTSSENVLEAARYNDTWYGLNTQTYNTSTGYTTKFIIQVNARTISNDATDFNNFAKSTVAHEFGHSFWLCDNPTTSSTSTKSLMKYSRDRNTLTTPQTFDINNVNAKY